MRWLKPKKVLTDKQLSKVKTSFALLLLVLAVQGLAVTTSYYYQDEEYDKMMITTFPRGRIVEYTNLEEFCSR